MPIYEYACPKCGEFEITQRITDSPLKKCPTCKSKVQKLISSTSFQLKGSGWYATDYGSKTKAPKESAAGGKESGGSGGEAAKPASGESKSASGESKSKDTAAAKKEPAASAA